MTEKSYLIDEENLDLDWRNVEVDELLVSLSLQDEDNVDVNIDEDLAAYEKNIYFNISYFDHSLLDINV